MLSQVITWSTLDGGCTDFSCVLKPKIEKMETLTKNGDLKSEKGLHGDPGDLRESSEEGEFQQ